MSRLFAPIAVTALLLMPCLSQAGTPARAAESAPTRSDAALTVPAQAATTSAKPKAAKPAPNDASSTKNDQARYADREQSSGEAKEFRGGDTVVIGASAATAILAVLLLLILI
jgi:septum formation inhibitor MinC